MQDLFIIVKGKLLRGIGIFFLLFPPGLEAQRGGPDPNELLHFYTREVKLLGLQSGDTLVDIGAGDGSINAMYAIIRPGLHQILTDIDPKMLNEKKVRANYKSLQKLYKPETGFSYSLLIHPHDSLPLSPRSVSKVLCRRSYHEFENPGAMLKEMHRVLQDSGSVYVIEGLPEREGEIEPVCKKPFLKADQIISVFSQHGFVLQSRAEETMAFDNYRKLCVLKFKKAG